MDKRKTRILTAIAILLVFGFFLNYNHYNENEIKQSTSSFQEANQQPLPQNIESKEELGWYRPIWYDLKAEEMTPEQSIEYFLWSNHTSCGLMNDHGGKIRGSFRNKPGESFYFIPRFFDGNKAVCLLPNSIAPQSGSCLVYSFGINNEWSFDDAMEKYGCEVYSFDPSMNVSDKFDRSPKIHFRKIGLGAKNNITAKGWKIMDYESIRKMLGHENRIVDYLKIDIENAEWEVLPNLMETGALNYVKQLGAEVGFLVPASPSWKMYQDMVVTLRKMERDHGMIRFDSKRNPAYAYYFPHVNKYISYAWEIAWYNSKFLVKDEYM